MESGTWCHKILLNCLRVFILGHPLRYTLVMHAHLCLYMFALDSSTSLIPDES
jgi:hypothetical protein